jgi:hypothetical protein
MEQPSNDQILASVVRFLIDGHEETAARVLLACTMEVQSRGRQWLSIEHNDFGYHHYFDVKLKGPRIAYDVLRNEKHAITIAVGQALVAVLSSIACVSEYGDEVFLPAYIETWVPAAEVINIDPNWRTDLLEIARGEGVNNQATVMSPDRIPKTWNNLRFRSMAEVRIAEALDRAGAMFLPNCMARVTSKSGRRNREADFLVCYESKWGILEVDGEPFHPPSRTVEDHERDRLFRSHGVRVVEHFDATECYESSDDVVRRFLMILKAA